MKIFFTILIMLWCSGAWGATYTVCSSGCNQTSINAVWGAYDLSGGDIVEVRADTIGGSKTYTEKIAPGTNDDGSAGNHVTLKARSGDTITISGSGNTTAINFYDITYFTVDGFTIIGGSSNAIFVGGAGLTDITFQNINLSSSPGLGMSITTMTNLILDNITISNTISNGIQFGGTQTNLTLSDINISTSGGQGIYFNSVTLAGTLSISDITVSNSTSNGLLISATANFIASALTSTNNGLSGISFTGGSTGGIISYSTATDNDGDGFSISNTASVTFLNDTSTLNGSLTADSGDGFTNHDTSSITMINCKSINNWNSGFAGTGASNSTLINNSFYSNGDESASRLANIWLNSTGTTVIENNITSDATYGIVVTSTAAAGISLTSDYNIIQETNNYYNLGAVNFTDWKTAISGDANSQNVDPLFTDAAGGNFFPLSTSPAMGQGQCPFVDGDGDQYDMAGNLIWSDTTDAPVGPGADGWEIGAYQRYQAYMVHNQD